MKIERITAVIASLTVALAMQPSDVFGQYSPSVNIGVNTKIGIQSVEDNIRMPEFYGVNIGFELPLARIVGIEAGVGVGQFSQTIGYKEYQHPECKVRGIAFAPFVAPTLYLPLGNGDHVLLLRNELSWAFQNLTKNRHEEQAFTTFRYPKNQFVYQIGAGYKYHISERIAVSAIINYSTFNFLKGSKGKNFRTSTPLSIDIKAHISL